MVLMPQMETADFANSVDLDEAAHYELYLHWLPSGIWTLIMT